MSTVRPPYPCHMFYVRRSGHFVMFFESPYVHMYKSTQVPMILPSLCERTSFHKLIILVCMCTLGCGHMHYIGVRYECILNILVCTRHLTTRERNRTLARATNLLT